MAASASNCILLLLVPNSAIDRRVRSQLCTLALDGTVVQEHYIPTLNPPVHRHAHQAVHTLRTLLCTGTYVSIQHGSGRLPIDKFPNNELLFLHPLASPPSCFLFPAATTEQAPHGSVTFLAENDELAAEETVEIIYSPPAGMFEGADSLLYCGGFNGWDGEEDGVTMPMMPVGEEGNFRISINVPNFARVS